MVERPLLTPKVRSLNPVIYIERLLSTALKRRNKRKKRPGMAHFKIKNSERFGSIVQGSWEIYRSLMALCCWHSQMILVKYWEKVARPKVTFVSSIECCTFQRTHSLWIYSSLHNDIRYIKLNAVTQMRTALSRLNCCWYLLFTKRDANILVSKTWGWQ